MTENYEKMKLENQICFPLYALSREVIKAYKPLLDKHNLTYTQYITMLVLWEKEKITFKSLGNALHLDSGTLTPVLKNLEKASLIVKYRSKEDDRVVIVELTEKGSLLKEEVSEVPDQIMEQFKGNKEELVLLKQLLTQMLDENEK